MFKKYYSNNKHVVSFEVTIMMKYSLWGTKYANMHI